MTSRYSVEHTIGYVYDTPVHSAVMTLRLHPIRDRAQGVSEFAIETEPDGPVFEFTDPFGNTGHFLNRLQAHDELRIVTRATVEIGSVHPAPDRLEPDAARALERAGEEPDLWPTLNPSRFVHSTPALERFVAKHDLRPGPDLLASTRSLSAFLYRTLRYVPGVTMYDSPIDHLLETGAGVCQDFAHLMASILRPWGVPCRYVSGYLAPVVGNVARGGSHAWVETWFPGAGWVGFDPANDVETGEAHVRLAVGRDYADVPPTRGVYRGSAGSTLETEVVVERLSTDAPAASEPLPHGGEV